MMKYQNKPIRMAKIKKTKTNKILVIPSASEDIVEMEVSFPAGGTLKWYAHFEKQMGSFL